MPTEESTAWSAHELEAVLGIAGIGVWSYDPTLDVVRWSNQAMRLFGLEGAERPRNLEALLVHVYPEDRELVRARVHRALEAASTGASLYEVEHRVTRPDGTVAWLECRGEVQVDGRGRVLQVLGTVTDTTARRQAEAALRTSETQYRLFTEMASDYVYIAEVATMAPVIIAGSFERTTGITLDEMEARGGWFEVIHPEDRAATVKSVPLLYTGRTVTNEYRVIDSAGQVRWLRDTVRPLFDEQGALNRIMGGVQNISESRRLSEQLLHASKLEAVARLAGGIAHDFNNMLTVMFGGLDYLRSALPPLPSDAQDTFEDLANVTQRAAELTRGLLAFSRKQQGSPRITRVWDVLRSVRPIVLRLIGERIRIALEVSDEDVLVRIDPGQLELVLLNLASNARDAMPDGGTLSIVGSAAELGEDDPRRPAELHPGRYAIIDVRDTGVGMPPEVLEHLFEPFFTTKTVGRGTGLGLATSYGTIRQAGGAISVTSEVGVGSTFRMLLPRTEGDPTPLDEFIAPGARERGTEVILVVEDEPAVRRQTVRLLQELGYEVYSAGSAEDAMALPEPLLDKIELLVSDVVLPGAHGIALARRFQDHRRRPVVLMSGYMSAEMEALAAADSLRILAKPFTPEALARWVRDALERPTD